MGQTRRSWFELFLTLDQPLHHGPIPAHLVEQVIEQRGSPQRIREQNLGAMQRIAYLFIMR